MEDRYAELMTTFEMFEGYTAHGVNTVVQRGRVRELAAGDVLFREGEPATHVVLVLGGTVELFVERNGRELHLSEAGPSRLLGEIAVLASADRVTSARAAGAVLILEWDAQQFRRLITSDGHLSQRIFRETFRSLLEEKQSLIASLAAIRETAN
jgi:CRP/FNR family cyclic AMP-dependent transcriptional regulator